MMTEQVLSLKWNNHQTSFSNKVAYLHNKEKFTDVTLACEEKFYPAHKLILSTCSEYFDKMFARVDCKHPIIVLKDISQKNIEMLLNYMYLGEVNVDQAELPNLMKAAECLKIKGLAVIDIEVHPKKRKQSIETSSSKRRNVENSRKYNQAERSSYMHPGEASGSSNTVIKKSASPPPIETKEFQEILFPQEMFPLIKEEKIDLSEEKYIDETAPDTDIFADEGLSKTEPQEGQVYQDYEVESFETNPPAETEEVFTTPQTKIRKIRPLHYCTRCSYSTDLKSDLVKHYFVHTGERPFACVSCPYKTTRSSNLTRHVLLHHKVIDNSKETSEDKMASPVKCSKSPVKWPERLVKLHESLVKGPESLAKWPEILVKGPESPVECPDSPVKRPESPVI